MGAAGVAQEVAIASTPIPSAETGGRFEVPDTFTGVDNALVRLNMGEVAEITPRGETAGGGKVLHLTINVDKRPVIDFFQPLFDSHELVVEAANT
jgi:hypothetical protein